MSVKRTMAGVRIFAPTQLAPTSAAATKDEFLKVTIKVVLVSSCSILYYSKKIVRLYTVSLCSSGRSTVSKVMSD